MFATQKTTLKTASTVTLRFFRRIGLWIQFRSLETTMAGRERVFPLVTCSITLAGMEAMQDIAAAEVRRLKREYLA